MVQMNEESLMIYEKEIVKKTLTNLIKRLYSHMAEEKEDCEKYLSIINIIRRERDGI